MSLNSECHPNYRCRTLFSILMSVVVLVFFPFLAFYFQLFMIRKGVLLALFLDFLIPPQLVWVSSRGALFRYDWCSISKGVWHCSQIWPIWVISLKPVRPQPEDKKIISCFSRVKTRLNAGSKLDWVQNLHNLLFLGCTVKHESYWHLVGTNHVLWG